MQVELSQSEDFDFSSPGDKFRFMIGNVLAIISSLLLVSSDTELWVNSTAEAGWMESIGAL